MSIPLRNVLIIPQKATFEVLEKKFVFVIDKDGLVRSREINVSAELPHIFIVAGGLRKNDLILLEGLRQVHENQKIAYRIARADSIVSHLDLYAE
jgi:membrane fusion protein (multidrug efflux system)